MPASSASLTTMDDADSIGSMREVTRVIGIGLDAAEWWLVDQLMADGQMPNLAQLRDRGATAQLDNVREYRSELPWTLFWTGRSAATNGYWSTVKFDPASYEVYEVGAYHHQPFWRQMAPGSVTTFDVPHIPIFRDRSDQQVTAWGAHSPQYARASQPPGLLTSIEKEFGDHPGFERDHEACWFDAEHLRRLRESLLVGAERRASIVSQMVQQSDSSLFLTVMSEPHSIGHHAWHGVMPDHPAAHAPGAAEAGSHVRAVYAAMDAAVGQILQSDPEATFVVFSLHGMQANTNELTSLLMLPELLHRAHFGTKSLRQAPPIWARNRLRLPADYHSWGMEVVRLRAERRADRLRRDLRILVPSWLMRVKHSIAKRLGRPTPGRESFDHAVIPGESFSSPAELEAARTSVQWQPPCWWSHHWPEMPWFALPTYSDGHIRINLIGRERNGVVRPEDYDRTCDQLATMLYGLTNATNGRRAVEDVAFVRKDDPFNPDGPTADVVVIWSEPAFVLDHPVHGRIGPLPYRRTGEHSSNGFMIAAGPGIDHRTLGHRAAADLPPTILGLLGEDRPDDVVGADMLASVPSGPTTG